MSTCPEAEREAVTFYSSFIWSVQILQSLRGSGGLGGQCNWVLTCKSVATKQRNEPFGNLKDTLFM